MAKISELETQLKEAGGFIAVKNTDKKVKDTYGGVLPDEIFIQSIKDAPGVKDSKTIRYAYLYPVNPVVGPPVDPKSRKYYSSASYVHKDTELEEIVGKAKQSLIKTIKQGMLPNLATFLPDYQAIRKVGSDPEIFIEDGNGSFIPAFEFLPDKANKAKPNWVVDRNATGVYWDGWQAEFESQASTCNAIHIDSIASALKLIHDKAKAHNPNAKLSIQNTIEVSPDVLEKTERQFKEFGCKPSFNIYGHTTPPLDGNTITCRSAGGHIHFGIGKREDAVISNIVKTLDAIVGVGCVSLFESLDNPKRRMYYGLAGEFRLPEHGLEWRTLSNAWLCHPCVTHLVIDLARWVVCMAVNGMQNMWQADEEEVIQAINNCDVKLARKILRRNKEVLIALLKCNYGSPEVAEEGYYAFVQDVTNIVKDPSDIAKNWSLDVGWTQECGNKNANWSKAAATVKNYKQAMKDKGMV